MYTSTALLDLHARTHHSLSGLLDHCTGFGREDVTRPHEGFGYPTILLQFHHVLGAERYWIGVLQGQMLVEEREEDHASVQAVRAYRDAVVATSRAYLARTTDQELRIPGDFRTWGERRRILAPAHVVLRTQTHVFHHMGQITVMCRLLARPVPPGLDFPLGEVPGVAS